MSLGNKVNKIINKNKLTNHLKNKDFYYLNEENLIELNKDAIRLFEIKKADRYELLSNLKLMKIVAVCIKSEGNFYDKAIELIIAIIKKHAFASGNRRTALLAVLLFAKINNQNIYIKDKPYNSRVMLGIREDYYTKLELKEWLKNGKIKDFKRFQ